MMNIAPGEEREMTVLEKINQELSDTGSVIVRIAEQLVALRQLVSGAKDEYVSAIMCEVPVKITPRESLMMKRREMWEAYEKLREQVGALHKELTDLDHQRASLEDQLELPKPTSYNRVTEVNLTNDDPQFDPDKLRDEINKVSAGAAKISTPRTMLSDFP